MGVSSFSKIVQLPLPKDNNMAPRMCVVFWVLLGAISAVSAEKGDRNIKGMFVFGSSLVDNGNNNYLPLSLAKADFHPYGVDFSLGFTGRFTNGDNVIDALTRLLKLSTFIPPFKSPFTRGRRILGGVDFASGGSGIMDDTGAIAGQVINLKTQVENFEKVTVAEMERLGYGKSIGDYLFVVGSGGNDYSYNYFLNPKNVSVEAFTANLTSSLSTFLQKLYNLGARKFVLMSINPNGCAPMTRARSPTHDCIQPVNQAVQLFNSNLKTMADDLKLRMPASNLVFVNSYKILMDIIQDPSSQGFVDAKNPCCRVLAVEEGGSGALCRRGGQVCPDRKTKVFFDGLHPTEAVNTIIANKAFLSNSRDEVYPMNVEQLSNI